MDWSNERYVRLYTRDTTTWKLLSWQARALLTLILRKVDRSGVLEVGADGILGLVAVVEMPENVITEALPELVKRGVLLDAETAYVLPNFLEAQEAKQSDKQRQKEHRERRRLGLVEFGQDVTQCDIGVTERNDEVTERNETVTRGHTVSLQTKPSQTKPSLEKSFCGNPAAAAQTAKAAKAPKKPPNPDWKPWLETYSKLYEAKAGRQPTWGKPQLGTAKKLLDTHGLETCQRVAKQLFENTPHWIKQTPDILTLVRVFDQLPDGAAPAGTMPLAQILASMTIDGRPA